MFDLMITVPVRYDGLFTETHIFMYCSDPMGICAGREVFGYTKKDTHYAFDEHGDGSVSGWVRRRSIPLADFSFKPDAAAPIVRIVQVKSSPEAKSTSAGCRIPSGSKRRIPTSSTAARR